MTNTNNNELIQLRTFYCLWVCAGLAIVAAVIGDAIWQSVVLEVKNGMNLHALAGFVAVVTWLLVGYFGQNYFGSRR